MDQLGVVPDMAFGPGWFWGWQSYFTVRTCISCFGYFGPRAAGLLPSSFRRSGPHQLSNQRRLVRGALAPHQPAIIAKSLHNVGPLESTFLLSALPVL